MKVPPPPTPSIGKGLTYVKSNAHCLYWIWWHQCFPDAVFAMQFNWMCWGQWSQPFLNFPLFFEHLQIRKYKLTKSLRRKLLSATGRVEAYGHFCFSRGELSINCSRRSLSDFLQLLRKLARLRNGRIETKRNEKSKGQLGKGQLCLTTESLS